MGKNIRVKPGKTQSKAGFAAGLLFCLLGLFVVIPTFGAFGIIWTIFAVIITVANGMNAFSEKGVATHVIEIDENGSDAQNSDIFVSDTSEMKSWKQPEDTEERLKKLQSLYDQRLITKEEYDEKKKEILKEL